MRFLFSKSLYFSARRDGPGFLVPVRDHPRRRALDLADVAAVGHVHHHAAFAPAGAVISRQRRRRRRSPSSGICRPSNLTITCAPATPCACSHKSCGPPLSKVTISFWRLLRPTQTTKPSLLTIRSGALLPPRCARQLCRASSPAPEASAAPRRFPASCSPGRDRCPTAPEIASSFSVSADQARHVFERAFGFIVLLKVALRIFQRRQRRVERDHQFRRVHVVLRAQFGLLRLDGVLVGEDQFAALAQRFRARSRRSSSAAATPVSRAVCSAAS